MKRFILSLCALSILFSCTQEEPAPIRVESIELDSEELELIEGNSISLVATILPEDAENQNVIWSSSKKTVASVKDGEVTAVSVGEATITAKSEDGGKKATCVVTVKPKHISVIAVSLDKTEVEMNPDDKVMLTATIAPENASNKSVLWSCSDESIATVKDGELTALKVGEAVITATSENGGKKATCKVTVTAKHISVTAVSLDKEDVSLTLEDKVTLTATVTPDNASNKTILWTSSDESIATVKDGEVTALKVGEAIITATSEDGEKKATCKVTVNVKSVPVTGVSLNKQKARVFINNELTLIATIAPEDATNKTLIWTTSNASVATVKNGVVKGISVGEADITVKTEDGNHSATCKVSVTEESQTQTKGPLTLDLGTVTSTTATFNGVLDVDMLGDYDMNAGGVGFIYAPVDQPLNIVTSTKVQISEVDAQGKFTHTLTGLKYNSEYHYAIFVYKNTICQYGETQVFETVPIDIELSVKDITQTRATFTGNLKLPSKDKSLEIGFLYSEASEFIITTSGISKVVLTDLMATDGKFTYQAKSLSFDRSHYYRYYVKQGDTYFYSDILNFKTEEVSINLSVSGTTQLTATFTGKVELTETGVIEVGVLYSTEGDLIVGGGGLTKKKITPDSFGNISFKLDALQYAVTYHYCYYIYHNGQYTYGITQTFTTSPVNINLSVGSITQTTALFSGKIGQLTEDNTIKVGVLYTMGTDLNATNSDVTQCRITPDESGNLSFKATNLHYNKTYRFCYYTYQNGQYTYGPTQTFKTAPVEFNTSISVSMTSVTVKGTVNLTEKEAIKVGVIYYQGPIYRTHDSALGDRKLVPDSKGEISSTITGLRNNESYYLRFYTYQNGIYRYDEPRSFRTSFGELLGVDVTQTTATFNGKINRTNEEAERFSVGIKYSTDSDLTKEDVLNGYFSQYGDNLSCTVKGLQHGTTYYYCYFVHDKEMDKITYGNTQTLTTTPVDNINLSVDSVTQTTATFSGNMELTENNQITVGVLYSTGNYLSYGASGVMNQVLTPDDSGAVSFKAEGLQHGTTYNYRYYIYQNGKYTYGISNNFQTQSVNVNLSVETVTQTTAVFNGSVELTDDGIIEVGVLYSIGSNLTYGARGVMKQVLTPDSSGMLLFKAEGLIFATVYNYCYYVYQNEKYTYGPSLTFTTTTLDMEGVLSLTDGGAANCYIVPQSGIYKIETVQGNSRVLVGSVTSAEVLWESYGTSTIPTLGTLIGNVKYKDGYIGFQIPDAYKEGNAVIAAKDASVKILWSWHIWLTDQPQAHVYNNNAGTMMDRNLGATSATPGDVGTLGLLYQWGRKDPFLGSSSISGSYPHAESTITWSSVSSNSSNGTIEYATAHPTTFIKYNSNNDDWYYTGDSSTDNTRWTTSDKTKSIYDPCPAGWRVPDGGENGIWSKAGFYATTFDSTNKGISFSISSPSTTWYPASGFLGNYVGDFKDVGSYGYYWSASPNNNTWPFSPDSTAYFLYFSESGYVGPSNSFNRACGLPVRCLQE